MDGLLTGGAIERGVRREGASVVRPRSSGFTHRVLRYCEQEGLNGVPRLLAVEGEVERLSYAPGKACLVWRLFSDDEIAAAARLLRSFHETTRSLPGLRPNEVVAHGDVNASNIVWQDSLPAALIDLDLCHPGDPLEDLVSLAWAFCVSGNEWRGQAGPQEQARRCGLLAASYGLAADRRAEATAWLLERISGAVRRAQTNHERSPTEQTEESLEGLRSEYAFVQEQQILLQAGWNGRYDVA
jgi:thiamine kinase-like enzyme